METGLFSDESRFNLSSYDNRVRVWRPRGKRLNPVFALQQHTTPTALVMILYTTPRNYEICDLAFRCNSKSSRLCKFVGLVENHPE
ncbi:hypothetical protein TNCV_3774151 [Trichonephila clavipes]|nr:hypothetical protein TNCV_3774151 [Trichonephila clavipes]